MYKRQDLYSGTYDSSDSAKLLIVASVTLAQSFVDSYEYIGVRNLHRCPHFIKRVRVLSNGMIDDLRPSFQMLSFAFLFAVLLMIPPTKYKIL